MTNEIEILKRIERKNEMGRALTVFTPTYNRLHTLVRTYKSLCDQTCKDFIWLIIDDGSTDDTLQTVQEWQKQDNGFEIKYIYKNNGGMHTAHNTAYENINTELNVCIDSDDTIPPKGVEKILKKWDEVKNKGYAGIIGLDADFEGRIIGSQFPEGLTESTVSDFYKNGGSGDKKLVYRTEIINSYPPYPVFAGEKYVSLSYKYLLIDQNYKMSTLNEVLCNVEYQNDGSSNTMWNNYLSNPKGWQFWRRVRMQYAPSWRRKIVDCVGYCSSSQLIGDEEYISDSPNKLLTAFCAPFGHLLTAYIRSKNKRKCNSLKMTREK